VPALYYSLSSYFSSDAAKNSTFNLVVAWLIVAYGSIFFVVAGAAQLFYHVVFSELLVANERQAPSSAIAYLAFCMEYVAFISDTSLFRHLE